MDIITNIVLKINDHHGLLKLATFLGSSNAKHVSLWKRQSLTGLLPTIWRCRSHHFSNLSIRAHLSLYLVLASYMMFEVSFHVSFESFTNVVGTLYGKKTGRGCLRLKKMKRIYVGTKM